MPDEPSLDASGEPISIVVEPEHGDKFYWNLCAIRVRRPPFFDWGNIEKYMWTIYPRHRNVMYAPSYEEVFERLKRENVLAYQCAQHHGTRGAPPNEDLAVYYIQIGEALAKFDHWAGRNIYNSGLHLPVPMLNRFEI
ncbi:hypothetical protein MMC06_005091 [Schaereria dolodes]|nr:hypothetical protein [Schaereria dolodes]